MFWDRFEALCKKHDTRPNTVTRELGLSTAIATHWKNGVIPNGSVLSSLADYFGVSTDYLLCKTDNPSPASPSPFGELTSEEVQAVKAFLEAFRKNKRM